MSSNSPIADIFFQADRTSNALATTALAKAGQKGGLNKEAEALLASEFEALFVSQMLSAMFPEDSGDDVDPVFSTSAGDSTFNSMLIDEYGKAIAGNGGIGIASYIERELLKFNEVNQAASGASNNNQLPDLPY